MNELMSIHLDHIALYFLCWCGYELDHANGCRFQIAAVAFFPAISAILKLRSQSRKLLDPDASCTIQHSASSAAHRQIQILPLIHTKTHTL